MDNNNNTMRITRILSKKITVIISRAPLLFRGRTRIIWACGNKMTLIGTITIWVTIICMQICKGIWIMTSGLTLCMMIKKKATISLIESLYLFLCLFFFFFKIWSKNFWPD